MLTKELCYSELIDWLNEKQEKYKNLDISYIGESVFGRAIPLITLGDKTAQKSVLYVSTHHASENICTSVLLNFINDYLYSYERYSQVYQINLRYLLKMRKIYIIPMLNPDGVEYRLNGLDDNNPIKDRIISYNEGEDFTRWNANGRGVDLNHNYDAYFEEYKEIEKKLGIINGKTKYSGEYPESEPEVGAIVKFIRYKIEELEGILTLHTQGEEIYYKSNGIIPNATKHLCNLISRLTGYNLAEATDTASYGGLTDWFIKEFNKPSFTLECGKGENPLSAKQIISIYTRLKELFFTFPILF